jgi:hypothetical protein
MSQNTNNLGKDDTRKGRRRLVLRTIPLVIVVAIVVIITAIMVLRWCFRRDPLPPLADIESMKVLQFCDFGRERPVIEVPESCWNAVLAALSPYKCDPRPAKWQVLADLEIQTKNKHSYRVNLYQTHDDPVGAFASGPSFESRVYYRGGNTAQLKKAIDKAYSEAAKTMRKNKGP